MASATTTRAHKINRDLRASHARVTIDTQWLARPKSIMGRRRSSSSSSSCSSSPTKKSVHFSELSVCCVFEPSSAAQWYSDEDQQRFKRERVWDVAFLRDLHESQSANPASASICPVGVEQFLSQKGTLKAYSERKAVIRSVLIEQNRQKSLEFQDPDGIADLSVRLSTEAYERAQDRGKFQEIMTKSG
mmetsp:Transcript_9495/g.20645  ORF Transcript_9495/g.20645 Transcript_9495/m.20645 type:complete len:189 (+) Transcript_9495:57-623(+)